MRKYFAIICTDFREFFAYRLNFILWRVRSLLNLFILSYLWTAIYENKVSFGFYQKNQMLSYVLIANIFTAFILGTKTSILASKINDSSVINAILKPISIFELYFTTDLVDKFFNLFFVILETALVIFIFKIHFFFPKNIILGIVFLINGLLISFFINISLSFIAFWTTNFWAPRFLFSVLISFLSGNYFPLDILPKTIYRLLNLTPFPYLYYLTIRVFMNQKITFLETASSFIWVLITGFMAYKIWKKGNKSFPFWGR